MFLAAGNTGNAFGGTPFVGLLDTYPSTEPAGSLRKLRNLYSGYCIRVRRASDNATADIGFVDGEVDQAAIAAHCTVTDGFISILFDQSTTKNFVPSSAAKQPKINDGGTGLVLLNEHGNPAFEVTPTTEITMVGYAYTALVSVMLSWKKNLTDDSAALIWSGSHFYYAMTYTNGSGLTTSQNAGSPTVYVDGVVISPQNRDVFHDLLDTGVANTNIAASRSTNLGAGWAERRIFGYYSGGTANAPDGFCSDIILWKDSEITVVNFNAAAVELKALLEA